MCFSAEASFTASVVLAAVGTLTLRQVSSNKQILLAAIPLLFALQQFAEGILWLFLRNDLYPSFWAYVAQYFFLLFALVIWTTWIPLAVIVAERVSWRRWVMLPFLILGVAFSLGELYVMATNEIKATVVVNSIQYNVRDTSLYVYYYPALLSYFVAVLLPVFLSSLKHLRIFGILAAIGISIAHYFYAYAFTSVWCFFAAFISLIIYKVIKDNRVENSFSTQ